VVELLRTMELFANFTESDLIKVARQLKQRRVRASEEIFRQGVPGRGLYIVLDGRVRISAVDRAGRQRVLAFYGPAEFFGEMAVLTGEPRSATASAATDVHVLELRTGDFDALVAANAGITRGMLRIMVERQTAINRRLTQRAGGARGDVRGQVTVVISPTGGAGKTVLATNLAVALAQLSPDRVVVLDLDLLFGHVALLLNLVPPSSLAAVSPGAIRSFGENNLAQYLVEHPGSSLRVMAGTLRPEESEMVTPEHVRAIVEVLRRRFEHIVVDAGSHFSAPCLAAVALADAVMVVTTPAPVAVQAAIECLRVLREVLEVPARRIRFVQNQPTPYGGLSRTYLARMLRTERVAEIAFGGQEVTEATLDGVPLVMRNPGNATSQAIVALARDLEESASESVALSAR
jgi:CRP-like cAMP-binding protein